MLCFEVSVASIKKSNLRESPGIVTLITREEIANSGARDLIDILRLTPGLDFGGGSVGSVGLGVRGLQATEGKFLLLIDDQVVNDPLYGNVTMVNRFNADQIERIEIIRGPGSAKYGGYAGLAVIKIITRGSGLDGISVGYLHGMMNDEANALNNLTLSMGKKFKDIDVSLTLSGKQGDVASTQNFVDYMGASRSMTDDSDFTFADINFSLTRKGLDFRFIYSRYEYDNITNLGYVGLNGNCTLTRSFQYYLGGLTYDFQINDHLTITPEIHFSHHRPYRLESAFGDSSVVPNGIVRDISSIRWRGGISALCEFTENIDALLGAELFQLEGKAHTYYQPFAFQSGDLSDSYFDGKDHINMDDKAVFAQIDLYNPYANLTLGARYDDHSRVGSAFVPRIALTKIMDKFHAKILFSEAFRLPDIENINLGVETDAEGNILVDPETGAVARGDLKPERMRFIELEAGYQLSNTMFFTFNLFDGEIEDPVIYRLKNGYDTYSNFGEIGSRGIEGEFRIKNNRGYANLNYSYYEINENTVSIYEVEDDDQTLLAFPRHTITLNSSIKVAAGLRVNPSLYFVSERHDASGRFGVNQKLDATVLANLFVNYTVQKGLTIGMGVYDIFNEKYHYITPENSDHAPMPGSSREIILKLDYILN